MSSDVSTAVREFVTVGAAGCCEYCLLPQAASLHKHEPDHIVPRQHGGKTEISNLALACFRCNRYKGPNVGSFDPETGNLVSFFNPRTQKWTEHFALDGAMILLLTPEGRVTVKMFRLNDEDRVAERRHLLEVGLYREPSS